VTVQEATLIAAIVAAVTSILTTVVLRYFVEDKLLKRRAETEYKYEQRKAMRVAMGLFDGPMLQAAEDLHNRMLNLYRNGERGWLDTGPDRDDYYYESTVYRLASVVRLAVRLEQRAFYLEPSVVEPRDVISLRYAKAFQWVLTDGGMFHETAMMPASGTDFFRRERLRAVADIPVPPDRQFTFSFFVDHAIGNEALADMRAFIDGLSPSGAPQRWDRLVALDLLLMTFMNRVGFDPLHTFDQTALTDVATRFRSPAVRDRFAHWFIPEMKLQSEPEAKALLSALRASRSTE